jgi:hypothetical protein
VSNDTIPPPLTDVELDNIEKWAKEDLRGNLGQQATARNMLRVLAELRELRGLRRSGPTRDE